MKKAAKDEESVQSTPMRYSEYDFSFARGNQYAPRYALRNVMLVLKPDAAVLSTELKRRPRRDV
jgi:hypothetical protein